MKCKYCGEEIPEKAMTCPKCEKTTAHGEKTVIIGFIIVVSIALVIILCFFIHRKIEERKLVQKISGSLIEEMQDAVDDYKDETESIIQDMKQDAEKD